MSLQSRGQILPLFALMLVALFAIAALAVDVTGVYAARRAYRNAADAAALAGAQDLQRTVGRAVGSTEYDRARAHAIDSIEAQLNGAATCALAGDRSNCTITDGGGHVRFEFSVVTPVVEGGCATCDPRRSVQVTVTNPAYALSFARVLGINDFEVSSSAVAGLAHNKSYAIVTLRPPVPSGSSSEFDVRDIRVDGNTVVVVDSGDVGSNSNMEYAGSTSLMDIDPDFGMYYYDPHHGPVWGTNPAGTKIFSLIEDPAYRIPPSTDGPTGGLLSDAVACRAKADFLAADPRYTDLIPKDGLGAPVMASAGPPPVRGVECYREGIYNTVLTIDNGDVAIFEPGLYYFRAGLNVQGSLVGGYEPASEGVALVFEQTDEFKNRTGGSDPNAVVLNAGSRYNNPGGTEAAPARDYQGQLIQTNTSPAHLITVMVLPDVNCTVGLAYPTACDDNHNKTVNLAGGTSLYLAGVQYAPSDNMVVAGGSDGNGYVGQVISWTVRYTGGSSINQQGPNTQGPGILRLDAACTAPGTPCNP